jgi:hypothetical protein
MECTGAGAFIHGKRPQNSRVYLYFWLIGSIAACRRGGLQERNSHVDALPLLIRGRDEEPQTRLGAAFA